MSAEGHVERAASSLRDVLTEFATILPLLRTISQIQEVSLAELAYELRRMRHDPAYELMEQLIADMIVVFAPPKVGGQTITATIWEHPGQPEPRHVHFSSSGGLAFMESMVERCRSPIARHRWCETIAHCRWVRTLLTARRALRSLGLSSVAPKPVLIAGVREPVAQYISLVFEQWWMYVDAPEALSAESIAAQMLDDPWWHHCKNWFQDELAETTGIDAYSRPFPTERGWDVYENEHARVVIIRQENLDQFPAAFGTLAGIDPATISMKNRNTAETKVYSSLYTAVRRAFHLSEKDIERIYAHPQVRHFYSPSEIAAFQEHWRNPGSERNPKSVPATLETPPGPASGPASTPGFRDARSERIPFPWAKPPRHPHHPRSCRPCSQCESELRLVPVLQQTCQERLELIDKLDAELRSPRFSPFRLADWRKVFQRIFKGRCLA